MVGLNELLCVRKVYFPADSDFFSSVTNFIYIFMIIQPWRDLSFSKAILGIGTITVCTIKIVEESELFFL